MGEACGSDSTAGPRHDTRSCFNGIVVPCGVRGWVSGAAARMYKEGVYPRRRELQVKEVRLRL